MIRKMHNSFFSFLFLTMLMLAGFSLVLTDWTGSFRSGVTGSTNVAEFKGEKITQNEFARLVDRTLRSEQLNPAQAFQMGLIHQVLTSEIWQRMLYNTAYNYGVAIDDATLLAHLRTLAEPVAKEQNVSPAMVIKRYMENQGMSEAAFMATMRRELTNDLMRRVIGGLSAPSDLVTHDVAAAEGQTRDISYIILKDADVTGVNAPTPEQLQAYYTAHTSELMMPERRDVQLAIIPHTALTKDVTVTDAEVKAFYDEHADTFKTPERRKLAIANLADEAAAKALFAEVKPGADLAKVAKVKVQSDDFDNNDTLPPSLKPAFSAKVGDILPPTKSPLGWMVVQVASITPAGEKSFADAQATIKKQLLDDRAGEHVDSVLDALNNAADQGDTIDTVIKPYGVTIQKLDHLSREGTDTTDQDAFKTNGAIKAPVLTAAFTGTEAGRVLPPIELPNGDVAVVQIDTIAAAAPKPMETVKTKLTADWLTAERRKANIMALQGIVPELVTGTKNLQNLADQKKAEVQTIKDGTKGQKNLPGMIDRAAWNWLFDAENGKTIFQPIPGGVIVAHIDDVRLADTKNAKLDDTREALAKAQATEQVNQFMGALADRYNPQVNEHLLKAMFDRKADQAQ